MAIATTIKKKFEPVWPARVERGRRRPLLIVVGQGLALVALLSTYGLLVSFRPLKENE